MVHLPISSLKTCEACVIMIFGIFYRPRLQLEQRKGANGDGVRVKETEHVVSSI